MMTELERLLQLARERSGGQGVYVQRSETDDDICVALYKVDDYPNWPSHVGKGPTTEAALRDALGEA